MDPAVTPESTPIIAPVPIATVAQPQPPRPKPPTPQTLPDSVLGDALLMVLLLGLAAVGLSASLRKKWGATATGVLGALLTCDLCVTFWASALFVSAWWIATGLPVLKITVVYFATVFFATVGLSYALTQLVGGAPEDPRFDTKVVD